jgi:hypothetical protein
MFKNNLSEPEVIRNLTSTVKRFDLINYLIEKYKVINYLEIGVFKGENIREIKAPHKDGVDPGVEGYVPPEVNYPMTSDDFFELIKGHDEIKYDLIFIDGLHHADQVAKDIQNALNHIVDGGFILLHDCNPASYDAQLVPRETIAWNGDTWKAFVDFKAHYPKMQCNVVDTDFGVGVIKVGDKTSTYQQEIWTWKRFESNKKELLNLISVDEFKATY